MQCESLLFTRRHSRTYATHTEDLSIWAHVLVSAIFILRRVTNPIRTVYAWANYLHAYGTNSKALANMHTRIQRALVYARALVSAYLYSVEFG